MFGRRQPRSTIAKRCQHLSLSCSGRVIEERLEARQLASRLGSNERLFGWIGYVEECVGGLEEVVK